MKTKLNGVWTLTGPDADGKIVTIPATVPGCVHTDFMAAGTIEDPFWRDNSKATQWIEKGDYTYCGTFVAEGRENPWLIFEGLDTYCEVWLNGVKLGAEDNMFIPHEYDVGGVLKAGENRVEVRFFSPIRMVEGKPLRNAAFTAERLNTRRIQCTYGWDWVDRFVTMGIWREVYLEYRKPNTPISPYVVTRAITPFGAQLGVKVSLRDFEENGDTLTMTVTDPDGVVVFTKTRTILTAEWDERMDLAGAKLWYPAGYGEQPIYTLTVTSSAGESVSTTFGIRQVVLWQPVDEAGSPYAEKCREMQETCDFLKNIDFNETTSGFTVLVNGIPIMCKGGNWVPCEPFPSAETDEKIELLLHRGIDMGLNTLRVWGGGIFEKDFFYDTCDRLGILVTQDFLMACGTYPEDEPEFLAHLSREAEAAAMRLRNHPSLIWWSGDNENAVWGDENRTDFDGYRAAAAISPVLERLDPDRVFLPSSPWGGKPYASATRGTTHNTFYLGDFFGYVRETEMEDYVDYFNQYVSRFQTEQPSGGMPFVSTLRRFMTDEDIFGDDTAMSEFHTKNNPGLGEITLYGYLDRMTRKIFGEYTDGADRVRKMQMLQCEWVRISLELFRRNKGFASGIVYWMFDDCWPAANGWSFLDYYGNPKPSYYLFKRCAKPVMSSIERTANGYRVFVCNDGLTPVSGTGRLTIYDFVNDKVLWSADASFAVKENASQIVLTADRETVDAYGTERTVLFFDMKTEEGEDRAFWHGGRYQDLALTPVDVRIVERTENSITVTADAFTPFAMIDAGMPLSDNCFPLKTGETRTVRILP